MELLNLIAGTRKLQFKKGEILLLQGSPCEGIYYLLEGTAKLYSVHSDGKESIHHIISSGEFVGLCGLLGHERYTYSAKVMEDTSCCYFNGKDFQNHLYTDPRVASLLFRKLGSFLDAVMSRNAHFVRAGVRRKMADCLTGLAENFGEDHAEGIKIKLQISREEVASLVGVAPETAIRFISEFKRNNLITESERHLIVKDIDSLRMMTDESSPQ